MRRRDPSIPLFLWIATAALVHILWGGGTEQVVTFIEGERSIARLADSVRNYVKATNQRIEISLLDETLPQNTENAPPSGAPDTPREPLNREKDESELKQPALKNPSDKQPKKPEPKPKAEDLNERKLKEKTEKPKQAEPDKKPEEVKPKEPEKAKPLEVPAKPVKQPEPDKRIAVDQHVQPDQKDNPNARFIGDKANHVTEETQAKITSRDQNDANPTIAKDHQGAENEPGDSDTTELGRSEDQTGDPKRSPTLSPKPEFRPSTQSKIAETTPNLKTESARPQAGAAKGATGPASKTQVASKGQTAQDERADKELVPNTVLGNDGKESSPVASERQSAQAARMARLERYARQGRSGGSDFGSFGIIGSTPSGLNPNLTPQSALASVGEIQLTHERAIAAETRRSRHKGSWKLGGLERWRAAIENYVPSVQPGNQTALNTAQVPFARYLNQMHQRIHEHFADSFLASLESLPSDHPMNRPEMRTFLEIVLSHEDGHVVRLGITSSSGSTMFDVATLEAVQHASPFGASPSEIVSPDGNVYVHWEFHRNRDMACSTYFAHPYLIQVKPKAAPVNPSGPPAPEPEQHGTLQTKTQPAQG